MVDLRKIASLLAQRQPGHALPQGLYNDPEAFAFDLEAVFSRHWLLVGVTAELPKPGSRLAITIGEWPILLVKGRDGQIRGFHNSCRHRGARLCEDGHGGSPRLVCPYHRWTYDLDGSLVVAARMPEDFDRSAHGLKPVHVEVLCGVIYVCLADSPPDFAPFRHNLEPLLAPHNLDRAKLAHEAQLTEKANWKLVMENARECYHCPTGHPELSLTFPTGMSGHFDQGEDDRVAAFNDRMIDLGLGVGPVEGDWWQAMRFPLNPGCSSMTMNGQPAVGRWMCDIGDGDIGSLRWALEPNVFCHATVDFTFLFMAMPVAPRETLVMAKWLVHEDAVEGVDYQMGPLTELWNRTNLQDRDLAENNQRGVNALGYTPGPYSPEAEALLIRFTDWYCETARQFLHEQA